MKYNFQRSRQITEISQENYSGSMFNELSPEIILIDFITNLLNGIVKYARKSVQLN